MQWRAWCVAALAAGCLCGSVSGQTVFDQPDSARSELPDARDIMERHVEAIGGREAMAKIQSRKMSGTYTGAPFRFPTRLTVWQQAPDKFHLKIVEPAGVTVQVGYDGEKGWEEQGVAGFRSIEGERLTWIAEDALFWGVADYETLFSKMTTVGTGAVNGRAVFNVRVTTRTGREQNLLFDAITGLFTARRSTIEKADGSEAITESIVLDYKEFEGVKFPTRVAQNNHETGFQAIFEYRDIEINTETDHDYGPPEALQAQTKPAG